MFHLYRILVYSGFHLVRFHCTYWILAEINIETDIITSIAASLIDWCSDTSLVLIYDKTFKTDAIVFIGKRHNVFDLKLSDNVTVSGVNSLMLTISLC